MDLGNAARPPVAGAFTGVARTDIQTTRDSVPVELPPAQTVQSTKAGDAVRIDLRASEDARRDERTSERRADSERVADTAQQARVSEDRQRQADLRDVIERRLRIEPQTRSVVLQKTNTDTGETVQLLPDEATLKLRIFARQLAERAQAAANDATARYVERTA